MGFTVVAVAGAGVGLAYVTDLPESAGSMALSTGLWASVVYMLGLSAFQALKQHPEHAPLWVTATANLGFGAGLVLSTVMPMTRAETWAIDVGGGVGLAVGLSVAVAAHAPNQFTGWGTTLLGTTVGMATGFACARYLPDAFGALPRVVAVAPIAVPDERTRTVAVGAGVVGRF
jgi:hypothetical protein